MKLLVIIKRVEEPEIKIKIKGDNSDIDTDGMKYVVNPFDEIAVEEALRVRDANEGEVIVACVGPSETTHQIRTALAMGADRGVQILTDTAAGPNVAATAIKAICDEEKPDMIILGKQAVDDDLGQLGIILAEKLGWSQATFASKEISLESAEEKQKQPALVIADGRVEVIREVDGGIETLSASLPAVITTELRLNIPRYASLPGIMKAKKKPIAQHQLSELSGGATNGINILRLDTPPTRSAGVTVPDVATLVDKLRNEAKVI